MPAVIRFLLRFVLLLVGIVAAASIAFAFVVVLSIWAVRAVWARITGRPASPFVMRIDPRGGFDRVYRAAGRAGRAQGTDPAPASRGIPDVTDVEPKAR